MLKRLMPRRLLIFVLLTTLMPLASRSMPSATAAPRAVDFPDELAASLLCDCEQSQDFCSGYSSGALRQSYQQYRLEVTAGARVVGQSLQWRFIPQQNTAQFATTFGVSQVAEAISCWVKNPYGYEINLTLRAVELDGSVYESVPILLGDERNWRQAAFYLRDFQLAADSFDANKQLDLPLRRLQFRVMGLQSGDSYELYFDQLQVHAAQTAEITITRFQCPGVISAGESLPIRIEAVLPVSPLSLRGMLLQLRQGDTVVGEAPLAELGDQQQTGEANRLAVTAELPLPARLRHGIYTLRLAGLPGTNVRAAAGGEVQRQVGITTQQGAPAVAEVRKQCGQIQLAINDKLWQPIVVGLNAPVAQVCRQAAEQELHLYTLPVACGFAPYGQSPDTWTSPEAPDFSAILPRLAALLQADPQGRVILQVSLESPQWWDERNPTQLVRLPPAQIIAARKGTHASWASQSWQKEASGALRQLVEYLDAAPLADHIIGYQLMAGENGRWACWGNSQGLVDESSAAQVAFRRWLQDKYVGLPVLRAAWGQPRRPLLDSPGVKQGYIITQWSQITIPAAPRLFDPVAPALYDPPVHQQLIDYQQFISAQVANTIADLAGVVKETTEGRKLCGVAYGHLLDDWSGQGSVQLAGHLALSQILATPQIDFLVGPPPPQLFPTTALSSVIAHNKLYLAQGDEHTPQRLAQAAASGVGFIHLATEEAPVPSSSALKQARAAFEALAEQSLKDGQPFVPRVALVVDENSATYLKPACELTRVVLTEQARQVQRIGLPVDVWLLDDLLAGLLPDYQMYVFADAFALTSSQREALHQRLAAAGGVVVWIYAAGAIEQAVSGASMRDLMGIRPTVLTKAGPLRVVIAPGEPPVSSNETSPLEYGLTGVLSPRFMIVDKEAQSLGKLKGSSWPGLVMTTQGAAPWIYSVAPGLPASVLASLVSSAEIDLLASPGTQVCGQSGLVCLAGTEGNQKLALELPTGFSAIDLVTGASLGQEGSRIDLELPAGQTIIIRLVK